MIIFFEKSTGKIVGTVDGRIHSEGHRKMWIGDKKKIDRLIVDWSITKFLDEKDQEISQERAKELMKKKVQIKTVWEANHKQKKLFYDFDRKKDKVLNYKVDLKTKKLIKKSK